MNKLVDDSAAKLYAEHQQVIYRQTDRMFAVLMAVQWVAGVAAALIISPRTWIGQTSEVHTHVWAAVFLGGITSFFPILLAVIRPGHAFTRYTIAIGQMLMSSLLIHLTGGRIETHFHVFGSLAFLSFYRDWRVLVPATVVVAADHMLRGMFYPQSVFGVMTPENFRWVEHAAWVIFEDIFLVISSVRGQSEMREIAEKTSKLNASEARYRSVTDSASEAIITVDRSGKILFANNSASAIFGYSADELIGEDVLTLLSPGERRKGAALWKRYAKAQDNAPPRVVEISGLRRDGQIFETETSFGSYPSETGTVFTAVVRDITERKQAEAALRRSEEYRNLFRFANDSILILEPGSEIILEVNEKACEFYGLSQNELVGRSLKEFTENIERGERLLAQLMETGDVQSYESIHYGVDGREVVFLINASVIEHNGKPAIMTINRDITERKLVKDELEKNLSLLSSTFEATADGILAVDLDNRIVKANEKFVEMFGLAGKFTDLVAATDQVSQAVANALKDPDQLQQLMQRSLRHPDEMMVSILELKDGRIIERYTQPQKLDGNTVGRVMSFRDITERKRTEQILRESEARYRLLFDRNPYPIWVYDSETLRFLAVNEAATKHYGYSRDEFIAMSIKDIRPSEDVQELLAFIREGHGNSDVIRNSRHVKKGGEIIDVEVAAQSLIFAGKPARIGLVTDITERKRGDLALRDSEYRLRTLLDSMSEGLLQVDKNDQILYINNSICEMTGYSQDELIGRDWSFLLVDEGAEFVKAVNDRRKHGVSDRYEIQVRKKSGENIWVIIGGAPIIDPNGELVGSMGVFTDITERKRAEEQLQHDAFHDGLTGLANRTLFMDHLRMTIERGKSKHSNMYAVLYLDFDRFKVINDSLGHAEGDRLLQYIARRLENCTRTGDLVARLGGDEFVILLSELVDAGEALLVAERILNDLKASFDLSGREIFISTSIGIALSTSGHLHAEDMLRDADIAMYRAKSKGKAQFQIFDQGMHKHASRRLQIETEMRHALERGEFRIYYQPIIELQSGNLIGFEALLRWHHPERGIIMPTEFVSVAEENGLILKLGQWTVREACRQMKQWQTEEPAAASLLISVNLSCKEFLQQDLAEQISGSLAATGLDPRCLKLEITETHVMENSDLACNIIDRLRSVGVDMSLDDFGTGYSSLSYLHRLPVSYLKIDRSFISGMGDSLENREIVRTIIKLAQNLKMKVIAEGIETTDQLLQLTDLECEYGQGFLFAKPLTARSARQFISDDSTLRFLPADPSTVDISKYQ